MSCLREKPLWQRRIDKMIHTLKHTDLPPPPPPFSSALLCISWAPPQRIISEWFLLWMWRIFVAALWNSVLVRRRQLIVPSPCLQCKGHIWGQHRGRAFRYSEGNTSLADLVWKKYYGFDFGIRYKSTIKSDSLLAKGHAEIPLCMSRTDPLQHGSSWDQQSMMSKHFAT